MNRARLYVDEDAMRRSVVTGLRARGIEVISALDSGMINRGDEDHLAFAAGQGRVLYTFNLADFCILHQKWVRAGRPHAGIIVAPQQRYPVGEEIRRLLRLIDSVSAEDMRDRLEFLSAWV